MNNDVDCRPDFLERLVAPLDADPSVASVASLMVRPDGERIDSIGLTADATLSPFPRHQGRPVSEAANARPVLLGPAGTAAAYRRSAWNALGGLDEHITAYGEDFDLVVRLRAAGWETAAAPDAVGIHLGSATYGHRSERQRRYGGFGRAYLMRRYGLLRGRAAPRTALTEAIVVAGDAVITRDLAALQGRIAGWRAAGGLPPSTRSRPTRRSTTASRSEKRSTAAAASTRAIPAPGDRRAVDSRARPARHARSGSGGHPRRGRASVG